MSVLHSMDGGEISLAIDIDQGARIASLGVGTRWVRGPGE
jgi:hypothetical protein